MALSPIEDSYLQRLTSSQFPDMPASEPAMPVDAAALDAPSMDGMQLAAGPSQTVSDAGPSIGPIPRNTFQTAVGKLGELIQSGAEKIDFDVIGLPGVGSMTLKDLTVGDLGKVLQDMSYGFMPVRGGNVATGGIGTFGLKADPAMELLNAAPAVVSVAKGAAKAAKATKGMPVGMSTEAVGGMDGVLTQSDASISKRTTANSPWIAREDFTAYINQPRQLQGFKKDGPNKAFGEQNYKHSEFVEVKFEDGTTHVDAIRGLNKTHALSRAFGNWPDASAIRPLARNEVQKLDPDLVKEVEAIMGAAKEQK